MPVHLPGHVVEHLHDLRDQRGLSVVGVSVNIPFGHAPYIEVEGVAVWVARRPDLNLPEVKNAILSSFAVFWP